MIDKMMGPGSATLVRVAEIKRVTAETDIELKLNLDGKGESVINIKGCGFMEHMLTLFAHHGRFDLNINASGDTHVDLHHITEDLGICLGQAFNKALGERRGIVRYGYFILPMDEALILTAIDFSGRAHLNWDVNLLNAKVGEFDTELAKEFWLGFVRQAACALHVKQLAGENTHHILEGAFKSVARSLRQAVSIDKDFKDEIASTKGVI